MADPRSDTGAVIRSVEFYNNELAPLADGRVYVSMLISNDGRRRGAQLLTQEIACDTGSDDRPARSDLTRSLEGDQPRAVGTPDDFFLQPVMIVVALSAPVVSKMIDALSDAVP